MGHKTLQPNVLQELLLGVRSETRPVVVKEKVKTLPAPSCRGHQRKALHYLGISSQDTNVKVQVCEGILSGGHCYSGNRSKRRGDVSSRGLDTYLQALNQCFCFKGIQRGGLSHRYIGTPQKI